MISNVFKHALTAATIITTLLVSPIICHSQEVGSAVPGYTGEWKEYPVFDRMVKKIMEGERYVYIWAHQSLYTNHIYDDMYNTPLGVVLYYDKQNPEKGIQPLQSRVRLGGSEVRQAEYNVRGKYLVIVYTDGTIDMLPDSGGVHTLNKATGNSAPMPVFSQHIGFALTNNDAWISTQNGYFHLDGNNFRISEAVDMQADIRAINRVGNYIVAISGNKLYEAPYTRKIAKLSDFTEVMEIGSADLIMPVSNSSFVTLTDYNNTPACQLTTYRRGSDGTYTKTLHTADTGFYGQLSNGWVNDDPNPYFVCIQNEAIMQPNRDGYMLFSKAFAYQITLPQNDTDPITLQRRTLNVQYPRYMGSYDFEKFWMFTPYKGFHLDTATGYETATNWSVGKYIVPETPHALFHAKMQYSPQYGVLVMNGGNRMDDGGYVPMSPVLLSGLKNGKWTSYSPKHFQPDVCKTNPSLDAIWSNPYTLVPVPNPVGFYMDPLHPEYAFVGATCDGMAMLNLSNITGQILHFGAGDSNTKDFPGFRKVTPAGSWRRLCSMHPAGFDADNNYWVYYVDAVNNVNSRNGLHLWVLTPEARKKGLDEQNMQSMGEFGKIFIPFDDMTTGVWRAYGLALRHPANKNTLFLSSEIDGMCVVRYNHKGTLADSSDDSYEIIHTLQTGDGAIHSLKNGVYGFQENPYNGDIYVFTFYNAFTIHPNARVNGSSIEAEVLSITSHDGHKVPVVPYQNVRNIQFDEYQRMWIATQSDGVVGVNADMTEVIARYNMTNSPLPSDKINDVCWNPETKELMIATEKGILSTSPDLRGSVSTGSLLSSPFVEPQAVTPDFAGNVTLHNIPNGAVIVVVDGDNKTIANLGSPYNNTIVWNLHDSDNRPVASGRYRLVDRSSLMKPIDIPVLR